MVRHLRVPLFAVAAVSVVASAPATVLQGGSTFCADDPNNLPASPPVLRPVDEAHLRPDFLRFRRELRDIARRRDEAGLIRMVDPDIRISFGDNNGIENFRKLVRGVPEQSASDFWSDLARVLDLGGRFREDRNAFMAPYVYGAWPGRFDALNCAAVVGADVRVRGESHDRAKIVTTVSYALVRLHPGADDGWMAVELSDGRRGYISARYVYSPSHWRAVFNDDDGRWRMTAFIAGD